MRVFYFTLLVSNPNLNIHVFLLPNQTTGRFNLRNIQPRKSESKFSFEKLFLFSYCMFTNLEGYILEIIII